MPDISLFVYNNIFFNGTAVTYCISFVFALMLFQVARVALSKSILFLRDLKATVARRKD